MTNSGNLSSGELRRYSRQIVLPEIGIEGQKRLKNARVLIVGVGGLGSSLALYLAAAGVGTIGLIDGDLVELSNLHRQILFSGGDVGRPKAEVAKERLLELNGDINITAHYTRLTSKNAEEHIAQYDIVADASDNFSTRYLISDACVLSGKPLVFGSVHKFEGQVAVLCTNAGPCYRCLFPESPPKEAIPNCEESGVLGVAPGLIGTLQATEILKLLLSIGEPLIGRLLILDVLTMEQRTFNVERDPRCAACGESPQIHTLQEHESYCEAKNTTTKSEIMSTPGKITVEELATMRKENVKHLLLDIREPFEYEIANIGGTLIPMGEIVQRQNELPHDTEIVVLCHHGNRSARVADYLKRQGFENILDLLGGIDAWSTKVDPEVPRY